MNFNYSIIHDTTTLLSIQVFSAVQNWNFLKEEIINLLYENAKYDKELCGFLPKKCNCAMASVRDLDIRKPNFF